MGFLTMDVDEINKLKEKNEILEKHISHLKNENSLLYGRLNMIRELASKEIERRD